MNIFLDTNIFLHFRYEEISWKDISGSPSGKIIVAPIVLKELDKHKIGTNAKRAKKARTVLQKLNKVIEGDEYTLGGFEVVLSDLSPDRSIFDINHLDNNSPDDQLLATILTFKSDKKYSSEEFLLITDDSYPKLKSKSLNIKTSPPPVEFFIQPDDAEVKEIQRLKKEVEALKYSSPKLSLVFKEGNYLEIKKDFSFTPFEEYILEKIANIEQRFPYLLTNQTSSDTLSSGVTPTEMMQNAISRLQQIPQESIDAYNNGLDTFKNEYKTYLGNLYKYERALTLSVQINLILKNLGTLPAEDIDVYFHFPDGFELFNEDEYPEKPIPPKSPSKPKSIFETKGLINVSPPPSFFFKPISNFAERIVAPNFSKPTIRKTNSYDVDFGLKRLKHNEFFEVDPLIIVFSEPEEVKSFKIEYRITCANLREELKGDLSVKISPINKL